MTQEAVFDIAINDDNNNDDIDLRQFPHNAWPPQAYAYNARVTMKTRPAAYRAPVDEGILKSIMKRHPEIMGLFRSQERIVIAYLKDCFIFKYLHVSSLKNTFFLGVVQCDDGFLFEEQGFYEGFPAYNALKVKKCVSIATFPANSGDAINGAIQNVIQVLTGSLSSSVDLIVIKTSEVPGLPSRVKQINPMQLLRHGRLDDLTQYLLDRK